MTSISSVLSSSERAILATIAYTDQFEHPLTRDELHQRLLHGGSKKTFSLDLQSLLNQGLLEQEKNKHAEEAYLFLKGRKAICAVRRKREVCAHSKQHQVDQVIKFCKVIPWISAVYLTGSQAMLSAEPESDIDFMIVTQTRRMWLSRLLISIFAQLHGKRRSWNHEEPGSWCFNLWLDEQHLAVESPKQDTYRAYELLQAKVLLDKANIHQALRTKNQWVTKILPQGIATASTLFLQRETPAIVKELLSPVLDLCDWVMWQLQHWYMKHHQTTEKVARGFAFFHPRDTQRMIYEGWVTALQRCLSKKDAVEILQPYVRHHSA
jgi:predicted nucleotidyltransferase